MLEKFTWYKQSAYKWKGEGITVYIDPWGLRAQEEPADVVFITHAHADHFEPTDIEQVKTDVALICVGGDPYVMNASEAAGVVKKIKPELAVPNHYGFVVGVASDGETFAKEAAPINVQIMKPVNAFERTGAATH